MKQVAGLIRFFLSLDFERIVNPHCNCLILFIWNQQVLLARLETRIVKGNLACEYPKGRWNIIYSYSRVITWLSCLTPQERSEASWVLHVALRQNIVSQCLKNITSHDFTTSCPMIHFDVKAKFELSRMSRMTHSTLMPLQSASRSWVYDVCVEFAVLIN